jgi:histidinol-phosphatase (PHP family)
MKPTKIDLHNHTVRCNHATGTVDEYIERAIELGIGVYGFSEHAPIYFDEG